MRINLDSLFKDIKHIVDAPARVDVKEPTENDFKDILASVSPETRRNLNNSKPVAPTSAVADLPPAYDPHARARFNSSLEPPASLELYPLQPITPNELPTEDTAEGVKTPSIVDAKRVPSALDFQALHHSERVETVKKLVEEAGLKQGIDPALSMAVVAQESSFDTHAISSDGFESKGLFQLLDSTGLTLLERASMEDRYNPFDPKLNVRLGVSYLRYLHEIFGTPTELPGNLNTMPAANSSSLEKLAVAAFNAGEGRVASAQARAKRDGLDGSEYDQVETYLPDSTREYVRKVLQHKSDFRSKFYG